MDDETGYANVAQAGGLKADPADRLHAVAEEQPALPAGVRTARIVGRIGLALTLGLGVPAAVIFGYGLLVFLIVPTIVFAIMSVGTKVQNDLANIEYSPATKSMLGSADPMAMDYEFAMERTRAK